MWDVYLEMMYCADIFGVSTICYKTLSLGCCKVLKCVYSREVELSVRRYILSTQRSFGELSISHRLGVQHISMHEKRVILGREHDW